jgi:DNA-damage-inducible protein D
MTDLIKIVQQSFENIKISDKTWFDFWSARDLMKVLWYSKWENFNLVIEKAKISCENSWQSVKNHFPDIRKMVNLWSWSKRSIQDYLLTRYACYLIAQNWNSEKQEISFAQTYFASQTRKQEISELETEEDKRLEARQKLKISEEKKEKTVYQRWIRLPVEFATFKNKKIETLYNMSVKALKSRRWIPEKRALADFDSEVELKAKDFIYAMTDHNIKENNIIWKQHLENELVSNAKETRKTMIARWIIPEQLKPQPDLKLIEKRRKIESKKIWENKKLK